MSNGNNFRHWHQFIFRTWLWQLLQFFPPGDGGLHFAKNCFFFFQNVTVLRVLYRSLGTRRTLRPVAEQHANTQSAACAADTLVIWYPFDFSHGLGPCFSYPLQQGQKWKIWIYFILFFCSLRILKYLSPSCAAEIRFCGTLPRVAPTFFSSFHLTNTSL